MVFVTGDTHGGFQRFEMRYFPRKSGLTRDDYVVICGDFGGVWDGSLLDQRSLDWLENAPFTTLFVDGNHENFDILNAMPVEEWHGGKTHRVRPHILHLMRGQVFEYGGFTWFTMGGAASHDVRDGLLDPEAPDFDEQYRMMQRQNKNFRVKGQSWWEEELPSAGEYAEAVHNLDRAGRCVDCVLTHCAPTSIQQKLCPSYTPDKLTDFLQMVKRRCAFSTWFFGHYHRNQVIDKRFILQWEQIVQVA